MLWRFDICYHGYNDYVFLATLLAVDASLLHCKLCFNVSMLHDEDGTLSSDFHV